MSESGFTGLEDIQDEESLFSIFEFGIRRLNHAEAQRRREIEEFKKNRECIRLLMKYDNF